MKSGIKQRANNKAQSRSSENVNKINKLLKMLKKRERIR